MNNYHKTNKTGKTKGVAGKAANWPAFRRQPSWVPPHINKMF